MYIHLWPKDGDTERSSSIETAAIAHMVLHPAWQPKQLLYADRISFYADRSSFYADRNSLYVDRSIFCSDRRSFMPIAAAFTTTEAASLPVEAMDHLEHSRCVRDDVTQPSGQYHFSAVNITFYQPASVDMLY